MKKLKEAQTMFSGSLWQWKSDLPLSVLALLQDLFSHLIGGSDALPGLIEAFGYLGNPCPGAAVTVVVSWENP